MKLNFKNTENFARLDNAIQINFITHETNKH